MGEPNDGVIVSSPGAIQLDKADIFAFATNGTAGTANINDGFSEVAIESDARNDDDPRRIRVLTQKAAPGAVILDERCNVGDIENHAIWREMTGRRKARVFLVTVGPVLLCFRGKSRKEPRSLFAFHCDFGDEAGRDANGSTVDENNGTILGCIVKILEQRGINGGFVLGELR